MFFIYCFFVLILSKNLFFPRLDFSRFLVLCVCVDFFNFFTSHKVENFSHHDTHHRTARSHQTTQPNTTPPNIEPPNHPTTQHPTQHQTQGEGTKYNRRDEGVDSRPGREEVANLPAEGEEGANAQPEEVECEPPRKGVRGEGRGEPPLKDHLRERRSEPPSYGSGGNSF